MARAIPPILEGLAVMCCRVRQRPEEQGEPAFAEAAQGPLDGVAGTGIDIEFTAVWRLLDRDVQADASAFIARIG